ncbi:hypothetical protein J7K24_02215 [bacterium]|nr:hypothetical protein [bacterium]
MIEIVGIVALGISISALSNIKQRGAGYIFLLVLAVIDIAILTPGIFYAVGEGQGKATDILEIGKEYKILTIAGIDNQAYIVLSNPSENKEVVLYTTSFDKLINVSAGDKVIYTANQELVKILEDI